MVCSRLDKSVSVSSERTEEKFKKRLGLDKAKIESLEAELARLRLNKERCEEALAMKNMALAIAESWRQQIFETLASTEHQLNQMHCRFEEVENIWQEEFSVLADRLHEQQRVLPYTLLYKFFTSSTFEEFVNACVKAQIEGTVIEALEMVKEDFPEVDVCRPIRVLGGGE